MSNDRKKTKKIGRPPAWLWYPAKFFVGLWFRIRYRVKIDNSVLRGHRGPALILATHTSGMDHVLSGMAIPGRATYVMSQHFYSSPAARKLFGLLHMIPKKMFCPDARSVLMIIRAVREGNTVVLFPEGRLTWYSRSLEVAAGTGELVKHLGVDTYTLLAEGAGKTFPKWSASGPRCGRINIMVKKLFDREEIAQIPTEVVDEKIREAIKHDESRVLPDVRFRSRDTSLGLDGILWVCPVCGASGTLESGGGEIRCSACGAAAELDEYGQIRGLPEECEIHTPADWYEFCASTLDTSVPLVEPVSVGACDDEGNMRRDIGLGTLTVDREKVLFEGTVDGAPVTLSRPVSEVVAFPVTVNDHIDVYFGGRLYIFSPVADRRRAIIPVAYLDRVTGEKTKG